MDTKEVEKKLLPYVEEFSLGFADRMTYKSFEAMKGALLKLCVLCHTKGELAATKKQAEKLEKSLQV